MEVIDADVKDTFDVCHPESGWSFVQGAEIVATVVYKANEKNEAIETNKDKVSVLPFVTKHYYQHKNIILSSIFHLTCQ